MLDFEYYNPTRIIFGKDRLSELISVVPSDSTKVVLVYGQGSATRSGLVDRVKSILGNRIVGEFSGIEANPHFSTLVKGMKLINDCEADFLLAIGGGSVMDGTKFMALGSQYEYDDLLELLLSYRVGDEIHSALPLGVICTLPATGSEMNSGGVISHEDGKFYFNSPLVFPQFSFLDPSLTFTLPREQVANGIIDAFVHIIEGYVTKNVEARFQDRACEGLLRTLIEIGRKTMDNPEDYDTRANLVWCSTMALNGMLAVGTPEDWRGHMLGHMLTACYGIDHGKSLAVVMPALWSVARDEKRDRILQFGERVFDVTDGDEDMRIDRIIEKMRLFFESLGVKTRFRDYDMAQDEVEVILTGLEKYGQGHPEWNREVLEAAI
ncbi:MAG: iron-containing alcohol dehydrogenase [Firmicutes bacterium]|nr:iron-containing alcohol dehydrogenase [Bacillota bacterium]